MKFKDCGRETTILSSLTRPLACDGNIDNSTLLYNNVIHDDTLYTIVLQSEILKYLSHSSATYLQPVNIKTETHNICVLKTKVVCVNMNIFMNLMTVL